MAKKTWQQFITPILKDKLTVLDILKEYQLFKKKGFLPARSFLSIYSKEWAENEGWPEDANLLEVIKKITQECQTANSKNKII
jgi:hypothetical protein